MRYVGHLDLARAWERIFRRAQVPLEYTQGFNPRPRLQFAAALAVGVTSESEYLDAWLIERLDDDLTAWITQLNTVCPAGLRVTGVIEVPVQGDALPTLVEWSEYVITPFDKTLDTDDLHARAQTLLDQPTIKRQGRKKTYDLRPHILDLLVDEHGNLIAHLSTSEHANARPDELLDAMGLELGQVRVHRRRLHLRSEG